MQFKAIASATVLIGLLVGAAPAQQQDESIRRAATQPLRDARLQKDKIPEALLLAASAPYSADGTRTCAQIADQIATLTAALGDDVDVEGKKKGEGAYIASAATKAAVNTLIPGLGLVRVVTGADKAQRRAEAAAYAGSVRRAYLKGLGLSKGCRAPAAPVAAAVADRPELPPVEEK
ncbi:MAG: hypothetical protein K2Y20_03430 [Sphingomonas sp.]|nr:hypothetical protein [Sphingomonas sp.]